MCVASKAAKKRVDEAMKADRAWDAKHGIKQGSFADKAIDAAVRRRARKGK